MRRRSSGRFGPGTTILLLALLPGFACQTTDSPARDPGWLEVESDALVIRSQLGPDDTRALAESLHLVRDTVMELVGIQALEPTIETRVWIFATTDRFDEVGPPDAASGYFLPGVRTNQIALAAADADSARPILVHEAVHHFLHVASPRGQPQWLEEGLAELLSRCAIEASALRCGATSPGPGGPRTRELLPIRALVSQYDLAGALAPERASFYETSQLLTRQLVMNGDDFPARRRAYLDLLAAGVESAAAFERGFGVDLDRIDAELRVPVAPSFRSRARLPSVSAGRFVTRPASSVEVAMGLGALSLEVDRLDRARRHYESALAIDADNPRALSGLATVIELEGASKQGTALRRRALSSAPGDSIVRIDAAVSLLREAEAARSHEERDRLLEESRHHSAVAVRIAPRSPEAHLVYGLSFIQEGQDAGRGVQSLERARELHPAHRGTALVLARAYAMASRLDDSESLYREILRRSHQPAERELVEAEYLSVMREIGGAPAAVSAPPPAGR